MLKLSATRMDDSVNLAYFSNPDVVLAYARAAVNVGLWESERILFEKFIPKSAKLLELGCGAGRVAFGLSKLGFENLTATDFAPPMVEIAREINLRECKNIDFEVADATALTFPENSFDAIVFAFNGLQMIPKQERRLQALKEIFRVLKPGGIFIFTGHDRTVSVRRKHWESERERWESRTQDPALDDFGDWNHTTPAGTMFIHSADPQEMRSRLESVGFETLFSDLRSRICAESPEVLDFSDDTRFWICRKIV